MSTYWDGGVKIRASGCGQGPEQVRTAPAELSARQKPQDAPRSLSRGPRVGVLWHCPHAQVFDHGPPLVLDHAAMVTADSISEN